MCHISLFITLLYFLLSLFLPRFFFIYLSLPTLFYSPYFLSSFQTSPTPSSPPSLFILFSCSSSFSLFSLLSLPNSLLPYLSLSHYILFSLFSFLLQNYIFSSTRSLSLSFPFTPSPLLSFLPSYLNLLGLLHFFSFLIFPSILFLLLSFLYYFHSFISFFLSFLRFLFT